MTDKDWLARVSIAYRAYPYPSKEIEAYIKWMYEQYGIVQPKDNNENRI
jgi:hypothetical protein